MRHKRIDVIAHMERTQLAINSADNKAKAYCDAKMDFCRHYQGGRVFSTRFGDFFNEALPYVKDNVPLTAPNGEPLGPWDKNFNDWLSELV
jgi:hypothetical protein